MAAINSPVSPSIPLDIRKELVNPFTPWEVSQELFGQLEPPVPGAQYKKVRVLPNNKEWRFIWRYFFHLKPVHYTIKQVHFIHERHQQKSFEFNLSSIEREATTFPPTWDKESRADQRSQAIKRWKEAAQIFSPFKTQEADGRVRSWEHTKVLPLWHGTNAPICDSICTSGFVYFGKTTIPGAAGAPPQSTDDGYFGSGIYFTNSARYAADIYSKGHLLLGWVSMREPFPVVGDPNQTDMATLRGKGAYKNYNAHYVPVASLDPGNPNCAEYHPVQADQTPACDEYVVFHKSQALPQYWVELEVELPYIQVPGDSPGFVNELIPHLMRILQNLQVDRDQKLRNLLGKHLSLLLKLPPDEDLSPEQIALYEQINRLVTPQGINKPLRDQMVGAALPQQPVLPVQNLPAQEEKEPPYAVSKPHQVEPQPIAKRVTAKPSFAEKMNMLLAVEKDYKALEDASEELKGDREFILAAIEKNGGALRYASEELRGDREFILAAVQQYEGALYYASEQLRGDREIVFAAVQKWGGALCYASEELKGDREFVLAVVQKSGSALCYASEELRGDREIVIKAMQKNRQAFFYASKQLRGDREIVIAAVQKDRQLFIYLNKELQADDEIRRATGPAPLPPFGQPVQTFPYARKEFTGDRKIVLAAVQKDGYALQFASEELKGDREIVLAAVQQNGMALQFASKQLKNDRGILIAALEQSESMFQSASEQLKDDRAIVLAVVQRNGRELLYASKQLKGDREIVLAAVKQNGFVLEYASEELKDDREIVLAAIQQYAGAFQYASERLKGDREIAFPFEKMNMLQAVQKDWRALELASEQLKGDREIVLAAMNLDGYAFRYASEQLKGDKEFILAAIQNNQFKYRIEVALQYASEELKGDREFVFAIVQKSGGALQFASEQLKGDREIALVAIQQNGFALQYASEELKADREFILAAAQRSRFGSLQFQYASEQLKSDREFVFVVVQQDGLALQYASEELKGDREIVLAAVKQNGFALTRASKQLQDDREIVLAAVQQNRQVFYHVSKQLQADEEIRSSAR